MTWVAPAAAAIALAAAAAVAAAESPPVPAPVRRKPATTAYPAEALSSFVDAIIADKAGNTPGAVDAYRRSVRSSPQPNTYYNLGNALERVEWFPQAIEAYEEYLELVPEGADHEHVAQLIAGIKARPSYVWIDGEDLGALVLVDGKPAGPSPALVYPTAGSHVIERIGPTSYGHEFFFGHGPGRTDHVRVSYREAAGNVVLSAGPGLRMTGKWNHDGRELALPGRFALPPGRYETELLGGRARACSKIAFEVAKGDHITHVYVDQVGKPDRCISISVRTLKLVLPP